MSAALYSRLTAAIGVLAECPFAALERMQPVALAGIEVRDRMHHLASLTGPSRVRITTPAIQAQAAAAQQGVDDASERMRVTAGQAASAVTDQTKRALQQVNAVVSELRAQHMADLETIVELQAKVARLEADDEQKLQDLQVSFNERVRIGRGWPDDRT